MLLVLLLSSLCCAVLQGTSCWLRFVRLSCSSIINQSIPTTPITSTTLSRTRSSNPPGLVWSRPSRPSTTSFGSTLSTLLYYLPLPNATRLYSTFCPVLLSSPRPLSRPAARFYTSYLMSLSFLSSLLYSPFHPFGLFCHAPRPRLGPASPSSPSRASQYGLPLL